MIEADNYLVLCPACYQIMWIDYYDIQDGKRLTVAHIADDGLKDVFKCDCGFVIDKANTWDDVIVMPLESVYYMLANPKNKSILDEIYLNRKAFMP